MIFKKIYFFKYFYKNFLFNFNFQYYFTKQINNKIFYLIIFKQSYILIFENLFNFKYKFTKSSIIFFKIPERRELCILKFNKYSPFLIFK